MKRSTRASSKTGEKAAGDPQPQKELEPPRKSARVVQARKANPRVTWNPEPAFWQGNHVKIPLNHGKFLNLIDALFYRLDGYSQPKRWLTALPESG